MEGSCRFAKSPVRILIKNKVAFYLSVDLDVCCLSAQAGKSSFVVEEPVFWRKRCFRKSCVSEMLFFLEDILIWREFVF